IDSFYPFQILLKLPHDEVHLLECIAKRQAGGYVKAGLFRFAIDTFLIHSPDKHTQRAAKRFVHVGPDFLLIKGIPHRLVVPVLTFPLGREKEERSTKKQQNQAQKTLSVTSGESNTRLIAI